MIRSLIKHGENYTFTFTFTLTLTSIGLRPLT